MYAKEIKFEDYNGNERTETHYFGLSKTELSRLSVSYNGGFDKYLEKLTAEQDPQKLMEMFEKIILMAYGEKGDDGVSFIKFDDDGRKLSNKFKQTAAYDALFMELITDTDALIKFVTKILPKDMQQAANEQDIKGQVMKQIKG